MNIVFLTERTLIGDPEDGSERSSSETTAYIVTPDKVDEFGEFMVGFYESQDYNYSVSETPIELTAAQYDALKKTILDEAAQEKAINDSVAQSDKKEVSK